MARNYSFLLLHIGVFIVILIRTLEKFINPEPAPAVFIESVILIGFVAGMIKRFAYDAVIILQPIPILASFLKYPALYDGANTLYFAA